MEKFTMTFDEREYEGKIYYNSKEIYTGCEIYILAQNEKCAHVKDNLDEFILMADGTIVNDVLWFFENSDMEVEYTKEEIEEYKKEYEIYKALLDELYK